MSDKQPRKRKPKVLPNIQPDSQTAETWERMGVQPVGTVELTTCEPGRTWGGCLWACVRFLVWLVVILGTLSAFYLLGAYHGFLRGQDIFYPQGFKDGCKIGVRVTLNEAETRGHGEWVVEKDPAAGPRLRFKWRDNPFFPGPTFSEPIFPE
jgi:hypothetical protein